VDKATTKEEKQKNYVFEIYTNTSLRFSIFLKIVVNLGGFALRTFSVRGHRKQVSLRSQTSQYYVTNKPVLCHKQASVMSLSD